jgi:hypothetical protein
MTSGFEKKDLKKYARNFMGCPVLKNPAARPRK